MRHLGLKLSALALCTASVALSSCSSLSSDRSPDGGSYSGTSYGYSSDYSSRLPATIDSGEKVVMVDPRVHVWGAYNGGKLVKSGLATAGSDFCPDIGRRCHTSSGQFRVLSLGGPECKSKIFPVPKGGAPRPYCMFFHGGQALHGVSEGEVVEGNISHGCVRLHVADAEWLRFNFVNVGTKVIVKPY
jgi:lipoprotein-anchoring transpeptidase ErfK/SrfK